MPTRHKGEEKSAYMSRCMSYPEMKSKFPKRKQRVAVCYNYAEEEEETLGQMLSKGKAKHNNWYTGFYDGYYGHNYNDEIADKHYRYGYKEGGSIPYEGSVVAERAVSKVQQQAAAIALHGEPKSGSAAAEMKKSMSKEELHKFSSTKRKGLPKKVKEAFAIRLGLPMRFKTGEDFMSYVYDKWPSRKTHVEMQGGDDWMAFIHGDATVKAATYSGSNKQVSWLRADRDDPDEFEELNEMGHSVPVEDMVRELERLVGLHERAVLSGRNPRDLDDLENAIDQLQTAIEQKQREIQTEAIKGTSFKQFLLETPISAKQYWGDPEKQKEVENKLRQQGRLPIDPAQSQVQNKTAILKRQALRAAINAYRYVSKLGPQGEQALMSAFKAIGPQGTAGAALYNQVKARLTQGKVAQPVQQAQITKPVTAAFDFKVGGKDLLTEVWGAYMSGMAKSAADMAAQKVGTYGAGAQGMVNKLTAGGKQAREEAEAKERLAAQKKNTQPAQAQPHPQIQQIQAIAKQLADFAAQLTNTQQPVQQGA